jgi:hypothetical protein
MVLNATYSTLMRGTPNTLREVTSFSGHPLDSLLQVLVPTADPDTMGYRAERWAQLVRGSRHKTELQELDPLNTLSRPLTFPVASRISSGEPAGVRVEFSDERSKLENRYAHREVASLLVDGAGLTYSVEGGDSGNLVITNGRTQLIDVLWGRAVRLYGALPASTFTIELTYTNPILIDWDVQQQAVELLGVEVSAEYPDLKASVDNSVSFVDRMAAYILYATALTPWP